LPLSNRNSEALDDAVSHLGSYLFHELTTPLGIRLELVRRALDASGSALMGAMSTPFRSFGTFAVWFPRGLLLRMAARKACDRLVEGWLADGDHLATDVQTAIAVACEQALANPDLQSEVLHQHLQKSAAVVGPTDLEVTPGEALAHNLATLEEQSQQALATEDPGNWALQAMGRVKEWMGSGTNEPSLDSNDWRKTKFSRALAASAQKASQEWGQQLCATLFSLMEHPGARFAAAEAALNRVTQFCQQQASAQKQRLEKQALKTREAWDQAEISTDECVNGGSSFRLFGGRSNRRLLRAFVENLAQFAHQRLTEDTILACVHFFNALQGRMQERLRDLQFCRQRLRHLQLSLHGVVEAEDDDGAAPRVVAETALNNLPLPSTEAFYEGLRQSATARVVLPESEQDLERAAIRLLQRLKPEEWVQLDNDLHDHFLLPRGGLHGALMRSGDISRSLAKPLVDDAIGLLSPHMPIMDVAQILGAEFGLVAPEETKTPGSFSSLPDNPPAHFVEQIRGYLDRAAPLLSDGQDKNRQSLLLVPASDMGRYFGAAVQKVLPDLTVVGVPGQADLMFCREQGCLTVQELHKLMKQFRAAYEATASAPLVSPHSRFDVIDWLPLDP
jgi:eukaryotic-like serine/threonine-protein kinase